MRIRASKSAHQKSAALLVACALFCPVQVLACSIDEPEVLLPPQPKIIAGELAIDYMIRFNLWKAEVEMAEKADLDRRGQESNAARLKDEQTLSQLFERSKSATLAIVLDGAAKSNNVDITVEVIGSLRGSATPGQQITFETEIVGNCIRWSPFIGAMVLGSSVILLSTDEVLDQSSPLLSALDASQPYPAIPELEELMITSLANRAAKLPQQPRVWEPLKSWPFWLTGIGAFFAGFAVCLISSRHKSV